MNVTDPEQMSLCGNKYCLASTSYVVGTVLSTLRALSHLIHQQAFESECSSYPFFVNEETEAQRVKVFGQGLFAIHRNRHRIS